jgi:hemolysin III
LADARNLVLFAFHVQTAVLRDNDVCWNRRMKAIDELFAAPKWTQSPGEEIANSVSHGLGLAAALIASPFLCAAAARQENPAFLIGTIIFVSTMWLLYLSSMLYHAWPQTRLKCLLQIVDHSAIFLLIAGTYSPFMLGPMRGAWGWTIFVLVWLLAIFGVVMKIRSGVKWKRLSLTLYLGMGWLVLVAFRPFVQAVPPDAVFWLFAGGIAYTAGVIFFVNERVRYNHFVWHLFVLAGTSCHFCAVFSCAA